MVTRVSSLMLNWLSVISQFMCLGVPSPLQHSVLVGGSTDRVTPPSTDAMFAMAQAKRCYEVSWPGALTMRLC